MLAGEHYANNSMRLVDLESGSLVSELIGHISSVKEFIFCQTGGP
ncbi:MAG: hypothetical protein ACI9R3_002056 [Verrucomicrobiales bacterium]|jgi:hypothetical protein